ncbi:MAG TPA: zinc ribbon domain-containing protein [Candidatus Sulfotelmatobacter sp.]|nr:zinc ribbon domain-containing protein [Candidatus Sulfotelmatobacter sp.]
MASVTKCPRCGHDLTDTQARKCPLCGSAIPAANTRNLWIIALIQFAFAAAFMLIFKFPRFLIAFFGLFILFGTALSQWVRLRVAAPQPAPQKVTRPALYAVLSLLIAVCAFGLFSTLLFGSVMFLNSWNRWHKYEGHPFHRSEFQIERVYFQKNSKSTDSYASGIVEGSREWMDLEPYLGFSPRSEVQLDANVSAGMTIPIYFFPDMKGRSRVQVYTELPPAEVSHRMATKVLNNSLQILAALSVAIFVLLRLRRFYVTG